MKITIAALQFSVSKIVEDNLRTAERMVRNAAANGANVIVLPELFSTRYFCQEQNQKWFALAERIDCDMVFRFKKLAQELGVVIPISFFERVVNSYYNTVVVADADGSIAGVYRKTHIPQGDCYNEKYYFTPDDNEYEVFNTKFGNLGVLICWDQWNPEAARCLALGGADFIVYPTAIGSEPAFPNGESYLHWSRAIQGHSAASGIPVIVANRIGRERFGKSKIDFYGGSFITDNKGAIVTQVGGESQKNGGADPDPVYMKGHVKITIDTNENDMFRAGWGLLRDRRPELYGRLVI
ncbi:N-carbamoylputrescine amidase [Paramecium bursaria Chlorella virus CZ-2]|nr:N-carbamoylputrescine amidase [Paramecium bursaria Chlorella virus CZ-2]